MRENRRYYDLDFKNEVAPPPSEGDKDDMWPVMATTARRAIDDPADHILPFPRIRVPVRPHDSNEVAEQASAELRRDFLNAWWETEEDEYGVISNARKVLLNEGRVCVRKLLKWGSLPDFPESDATPAERQRFRRAMAKLGQYEFLWRLELLDNLTVFEDPSNPRDPQYVFIEHYVLNEEARRLFPNAELDGDDYSEVRYVEYWTKPEMKFDGTYVPGRVKQFVDDRLVSDKENPYPYIPIVIEDAGFGLAFHMAKPHERYVGMTQHAKDIFVAESRQLTTMENVAEITGFSPLIARNTPQDKEINVGPRSIIRLEGGPDDPNREDLTPMMWPGVPVTVPQVIDITQRMASETLKFGSLGGTPQKGVETATEADQALRSSAAKLQGPVNALTRLVVKVSKWALMDVDYVLNTRVTVYGTKATAGTTTIGPKDINKFYAVQAELTTSDEEMADLTKARFWMDSYRGTPFLSAMTAMEKGGISDEPMKELIKRSAEDVYLSDLMRQARVLTGGQMFGMLNQMIQQMANGGLEESSGPNNADALASPDALSAQGQVEANAYEQRDLTAMGQFNA